MRRSIVVLAAFAASCTHVSTYRSQDLAAPQDDVALAGVSYVMPAVQYDIAVWRTLEKCAEDGVPTLTVKAEADSRIVPGERFELDPSDLSSIMKTSSVGLQFYDDLGTLKSINAAADDHTGDVLADAVKVGVGIASATAGNPSLAIGVASQVEQNTSSPALAGIFSNSVVKDLLAGYRSAEATRPQSLIVRCTATARTRLATLEEATATLEKETVALERLNARITKRSTLAAFEGFDAKAMVELVALVDRQQDQVDTVEAAKTAVKKALGPLQIASTFQWPRATTARPPVSFPVGPAPFEPTEKERKALCENLAVEGSVSGNPCDDVVLAVGALTETQARLEREAQQVHATRGIAALSQPVNTKGSNRGIMVREPIMGHLVIERLKTDGGAEVLALLGGQKAWTPILEGDPQWIPQLGSLRFLEFVNGPFESQALSLALRRDGRIESVAYESKQAAFQRFSAAAAKGATDLADAIEKRETERRDDIKYAREQRANARADEIAIKTDEISLLEKSETLLKKQEGPSEEEKAAKVHLVQLQSDIATLTAERDRLKLLQEIAAIQAAKPAP